MVDFLARLDVRGRVSDTDDVLRTGGAHSCLGAGLVGLGLDDLQDVDDDDLDSLFLLRLRSSSKSSCLRADASITWMFFSRSIST